MKKNIFRAIVFIAASVQVSPVWADQVYKCVSETGGTVFTSRPCVSTVADNQVARYASHDQRLEQVEREIVSIKFDLMEIERRHNADSHQIEDDKKQDFVHAYERRHQELERELHRMEKIRSSLVGEIFSDLTMPTILMGQGNK